ncbi:MAG: hypothetical protein QJR13_00390 [Bacillota bacterium]|nr:hypothetical protein [Bacillota bacterium]
MKATRQMRLVLSSLAVGAWGVFYWWKVVLFSAPAFGDLRPYLEVLRLWRISLGVTGLLLIGWWGWEFLAWWKARRRPRARQTEAEEEGRVRQWG